MNREEVEDSIRHWVVAGKAERGTCGICFRHVPKKHLAPVCGQPRRCDVQACAQCLAAWYGAPAPGRVCIPAHLACPYCKRAPAAHTLLRFNRPACELLRTWGPAALQLDPGFYHAWCVGCHRLAPALPRACGEEVEGRGAAAAAEQLRDFRCQACTGGEGTEGLEEEGSAGLRECPGCHVTTQKVGGCNHMTCSSCR